MSSDESLSSLPPNSLLLLVGLQLRKLEDIQQSNERRLASVKLPTGIAYVAKKSSSSPHSFSRLESLSEFHDSDAAISYLARLRDDKGTRETF